MAPAHQTLIEALHRAQGHCVLALTGAGSGAAAMLLEIPGATRTVLEITVPHHESAWSDFLGFRPEQFVSALASQQLARRAFERGCWLAPQSRVVGLGSAATLAPRPHHPGHSCHVTVHHEVTTTYSLTLLKGARSPACAEALVDALILNALAQAFAVDERMECPLLPGEELQVASQPALDPMRAFLRAEVPVVGVDVDGRVCADLRPPGVLVPGAFNPLHQAHCALAAAARELVGGSAAFELSVANVDKPGLTAEEVRRRLNQFRWKAPVWLSRAPTFAEKAVLFPGVIFAVGADTAERIVAPRYYGHSESGVATALQQIRKQGCRFLVAGRRGVCGRFLGLEDLAIPPAFRDLFLPIPRESLHMDVSSTQIRAQQQVGSGQCHAP